jgi:hypothetical protein
MHGFSTITITMPDADYAAWTDMWVEKGVVKKEGKYGKVRGIVEINSKAFIEMVQTYLKVWEVEKLGDELLEVMRNGSNQ